MPLASPREGYRFTAGEVLVVQPSDGDDPDALTFAGQRCTFQRWSAGYAVVKIEGRPKPKYFRPQDLERLRLET